MNRRNFIEQGSVMAAAIAGLPRALKSNQENYPYIYQNELLPGEPGQTQFTITVYHNSIESFDNSKPEERYILLNAKYYADRDTSKPTKSGEFKYQIKKVKLTEKDTNTWTATTDFFTKTSGDYVLPDEFPKDLQFLIKPSSFADILSKKGKSAIVRTAYKSVYSPSSSGGDAECFITTACVTHKLLSDNCAALQSLRHLRDDHMMNSAEGRSLVKHYKVVGPAIVKAIDACDNRAEIYDYMYAQMIEPAVALVESNEYDRATAYYAEFVKALAERYVAE